MPAGLNTGYYYLFLEQYFLLQSDFNLNVQWTVNFRIKQGTTISLYNLDGSVLYSTSKSLSEIRDDFFIHHNTCMRGIKKAESSLNFFRITNIPFENAKKANLDLDQLSNLILEKKALLLKNTLSAKISLPIVLKEIAIGKILDFTSIKAAVLYFKSKGILADRNIKSKYLKSEKPYKGYILSTADKL